MNASVSKNADVIIIGGGISGLTTAYMLQKQGRDVLLLEKLQLFGGAIRSRRIDGYLTEAGPNSTLETTPILTELITELGLDDRKLYASEASKKRFILKNGKLVPLPMSPPAFFATPLFSFGTKLRLLREPFIPPAPRDANESVAQFVRRRLGQEMLDYAINPFVAGVYAGDPERLAVRAAFPKLFELEQKYGSLIKGQIKGAKERRQRGEQSKQAAKMFSFRDGMQTLTDALAHAIVRKHADVLVTRIEKTVDGFVVTAGEARYASRVLVLATQAGAAASLCNDLAPEAARALEPIPYPPVAVVITAFKREPGMHPLDGFGFLIPEKERRGILGTIFSSTIFTDRLPVSANRAKQSQPSLIPVLGNEGEIVSLTSFVGGMRNPDNALLPREKLLDFVLSELRDLLGTPLKAEFIHVTQWERAIPQYTLEHLERMAALDEAEMEFPGLFFCANYRGGVSVGDCVKSADGVVRRILELHP